MAGARLGSFKKGGGGYLHNVDSVITDYQFTTDSPGNGKKKGDFTPLFVKVSFRVDGAEADETTHLFAGGGDDFEISEDGYTAEPVQDDGALREGTAFHIFLASLIEKGFPDTLLPDDQINFQPIIGTRVTTQQQTNPEATKRLGKRKGKDGKEYDRKDLVVSAVLALPGTDKGSSKGGSKSAKSEEVDIDALAVETLMAVLEDKDGQVKRAELPALIAKKMGLKHPQRDAVRKLAFSEDFLGSEQGWTYNAKKQIVAVDAE